MIRQLDKVRFFALATLMAVSTGVGCGEPNISEEQASPYVEQWAPTVEETLREMAVAPAGKEHLEGRLTEAASAQESQVQRDEPPYDIFVKDVYEQLDYEFKLVDRGGLTERGQAIWEALQAVEDHGLEADDYELSQVEARFAELDEANQRFEELGTFETSSAAEDAAFNWLIEQPESAFELDESNYAKLTETIVESDSGQRMQERLADYETVSTEIAQIEAGIEHLLMRNLARYSRQMKHFRIDDIFVHELNFDRWNNPNIEGRRPDEAEAVWHARTAWRQASRMAREISEDNEVEILHERIRQTLEAALTDDAGEAVAALQPGQPQYAGLQKEYVRYKQIAEAGGWEKVDVTRGLRPGREHAVVEKLKERLQVEEYYPADAPIDKSYDDTLVEAIEAYQTTHQMPVTGKPHNAFWSSLNIPAERRAQQIALNMKRWRESNVDHSDPMYVYVNVPDFHAEIWDEQEREMRFRVVVGNNDKAPAEKIEAAKENPDEDFKEHPNRTPTLSAYIDRVIYNPYWNVTPRIRDEEILPEVRASVEASYKAKIKQVVGEPEAEAQPEEDEEATLTDAVLTGEQEGEVDRDEQDDSDSTPSIGASSAPSADSYWSEDAKGRVVFDVAALKELIDSPGSTGSGPVEEGAVTSGLASTFPYLDADSGRVVVNSTDPDHIPAWYEANEYEVMYPGKKWEYVRMKQGDENALGKVKVMFPNLQDIYLHDTPHKALFSRDIRAFSHGCMRMHEPLSFAEYLLEKDGKLDDYDVDHILAEGTYEPIFLDKQIPVHIDYMTVRVDDDGRANFLADIYDYDEFGDDG